MQNDKAKFKIETKKRAYLFALDIIKLKVGAERINPLFQEVTELANILGSSILTLRAKR